MFEFAAKIILLGSILGMGFIILRKIPVLVNLPKVGELAERKPLSFRSLLREKIKPKEKVKFLKEVVVNKPVAGIKKIRRKKSEFEDENKEVNFSEDYWEKIRRGE